MCSDFVQFSDEEEFILRIAKKMRESGGYDSRGRCFGASLAFASVLRHLGFQASLIRWKVLYDNQFADHWAVRLNHDFAIDLTSLQFEAQGEVLQKIKSYPANFVSLREYPFEIFLDQFEIGRDAHCFSVKSMHSFYFAMFKYDLAQTFLEGRRAHIVALTSRFVVEYFPLVLSGLNAWAMKRKAKLLCRLRSRGW